MHCIINGADLLLNICPVILRMGFDFPTEEEILNYNDRMKRKNLFKSFLLNTLR